MRGGVGKDADSNFTRCLKGNRRDTETPRTNAENMGKTG
jgi:hypothetical protein